MRRLSFVGVGPQKSGTTWMDNALRQHPLVHLPSNVKETFFFDQKFRRGYDWYWGHFKSVKNSPEGILGEIGPSYFDDCDAIRRLAEHNTALKLVVSLRDPIDRCYSLFCHHRSRGRVVGSFTDACSQYPRIITSSHYTQHISHLTNFFDSDQILLVHQHGITNHPESVLKCVFDFLGIPEYPVTNLDEISNPRLQPANLAIARYGSSVSRFLRNHGFHGLVNAVKSTPVFKAFAYGNLDRTDKLSPEEQELLISVFEREIAWLNEFETFMPVQLSHAPPF